MRVVKAPDERKQDILDGAIRVFAKKGYDKTSISDIAKEIGISQGLCYRYYDSKEDIYDAALEEYAAFIASTNLKSYHYEDKPLREQIQYTSGNMSRYSAVEHDKKDLYELFHKAENQKMHDELFIKVGEHLVPFLANVLLQAKQNGEIDIVDPMSMARFLVYGQIGILQRNDITDEEKTQHIQECCLNLLGLDD